MTTFLIVLFAILLVSFFAVLLRLFYAGLPYDEWVEMERGKAPKRSR